MSGEWNDERARTVLRRVFDAAVASADPRRAVARHLPEKPRGRCVVVGAGKASAAMAAGLDAAWPDVDLSGVVVTRYG
jgi:glycerate 2-kinase